MGTIIVASYTFQIADSQYVEALVTCLGHLSIDSLEPALEGRSVTAMTIDQLPQLMVQIREKYPGDIQLTLKTSFDPILSLHKILPVFEVDKSIEMTPELEPIVVEIQTYLNEITGKDYYSYMHPYPMPPKLSPLTREQAWAILTLVYKNSPFFSAIDLPSENNILILTNCKKNLIELCCSSAETTIRHRVIYFRMDTGFLDLDYCKMASEFTEIFNIWLKNNRKGPVFPQAEMLSQAISSSHLAFSPEIVNIIVDYAHTQPILVKKQKSAAPQAREEAPVQKKRKLEP